MTIFPSKPRIVWGLIALGMLVIGLKIAAMSPRERCLTDSCREKVDEAEIQAIEDYYRPRLEAADRAVERANLEMKEAEENIDRVNLEISKVCREHPESCEVK